MKTNQFFSPEEASSGSGASGASDASNASGSNAPATTLTYNYAGQEITVDLSNPDDVKLVKDRLSKGHNMEKIAEERNRLKEQVAQLQQVVDSWNKRLEAAKTDEGEFSALVKDIEEYIGRPLSRKEKADLYSGDAEDLDPVQKELAELKREFQLYKEQQSKVIQERELQEEAKRLIAKLDAMEADKEKYPGFDREKVYQAAVAAGTTDFEMVYFYLNREALLQKERERIEKEYEELKNKRRAAGTETDTAPADMQEPPRKFRRIEDVGSAILEEVRKGGVSFFSE